MKKKLLNECLRIAQQHFSPDTHPQFNNYIHYSFVIQVSKIVDWGINRSATPLIIRGYPNYAKLHSETDAYKKAKGLLDKDIAFEVVNIRLSRDGRIKVSEPCKCCTAFLKNMGCKKIWFTTRMGMFASLTLSS